MPYANMEDRKRNSRENYLKNRAKRLAYAREYREKHKEEIRAYRESPGGKEYHRGKAREHYWRHRAEEVARSREWRASHPDKIKEYRDRTREKRRRQNRAWVESNRDHVREYNREYAARHPEFRVLKSLNSIAWREREDARCREDAEYYARRRAKARARYAKGRIKRGKGYTANTARRIPDTVCKGEIYDREGLIVYSAKELKGHIGIVNPTARLRSRWR